MTIVYGLIALALVSLLYFFVSVGGALHSTGQSQTTSPGSHCPLPLQASTARCSPPAWSKDTSVPMWRSGGDAAMRKP